MDGNNGLLKFGRVVGIHPEDMSIDVLLWDGYSQLTGVQVLFQSATTDAGEVWSMDPGLADVDKWNPQAKPTREITACVGEMAGGFWVCVGFQYPQVTQMAFERKDEYIKRYAAGLYRRVDKPGTEEVVHPSGAFAVFGADRDPEVLDGADFDALWKIPRTGHGSFRVEAWDGSFRARLRVRYTGQILLENSDGTKLDIDGSNLTITTPNNTVVNASAKCEVNTPEATVNATTSAAIVSPMVAVEAQTASVTASAVLALTSPIIEVTGNIIHIGNMTTSGRHLDNVGAGTPGKHIP